MIFTYYPREFFLKS